MNALLPLAADMAGKILWGLRKICAAVAVLFLLGVQLSAETRVALVIGNAAYQNNTPLTNPVNDARAIAAKLTAMGFDVSLHENLDGQSFRIALGEFSEKALNSDLAVVFYAGHGIEMNGQNYLIPVDAKMKSESTAQFEAVQLEQVLGAVRTAGKLGLVMIDACRNDPFSATMTRNNGTRSVSRGLAPISVEGETGMLISFAAEAGRTADDGNADHSPYTAAVLAVLDQPGLEVGRMFRAVRARVKETTGGAQVPIEQAQLPDQDIYLVPAGAPAPVTAATTAPDATAAPPADDPLLVYLEALKSGDRAAMEDFIRRYPDDPRAVDARAVVADMAETDFWADTIAKNTEAGFRAYLLGFPQGRYKTEATNRIAALAMVPAKVPTAEPAPELQAAAQPGNCPAQTGDWSVTGIASDDTLFVRMGPGTTYPEKGELAYNAAGITNFGCDGKWCQIEYGCISGYASAKYLTDQISDTATSAYSGLYAVVDSPKDEPLNLRAGPGTQYEVVATLPFDAQSVIVTDCQTIDSYDYRWCNLSWNAASGWGYGRYLQDGQGQKPQPPAPAPIAAASANTCFDLWYQRNAIFAANGYCFGTAKGKANFSNDSCTTTTPNLSASERRDVDRIKSEEKRNGC